MTVVMMAIFSSMVVIAWGYPPKSRFLPLVIGIPGILLTLLQLYLDILKSRNLQESAAEPKSSALQKIQESLSRRLRRKMELDIAREELSVVVGPKTDQNDSTVAREIELFGYFTGLIAGVVLFGFWLTIPVFLVTFLRLHERDNWMFIFSLTGISWLTIYVIFDWLLEISLHTGLISQYLIELLPE